jgi:hypothetical protein
VAHEPSPSRARAHLQVDGAPRDGADGPRPDHQAAVVAVVGELLAADTLVIGEPLVADAPNS